MATQVYVDSVTLSAAAEWNKWDTAGYPQLTGVAGTNTITATGPANLTLATSPILWFIPAVTNTGATTLNITPSGGAALTAKNVFSNGAACIGGELVANFPVGVVYDGTQYNIIGRNAATGVHLTTFTFNGAGYSTASLSLAYQKQGLFTVLYIPRADAATGTNSGGLISDTALPAAIRPTSTQVQPTNSILNNGAAISSPGNIQIASTGIITIFRDGAGTGFTNSASAGLNTNLTIIYYTG